MVSDGVLTEDKWPHEEMLRRRKQLRCWVIDKTPEDVITEILHLEDSLDSKITTDRKGKTRRFRYLYRKYSRVYCAIR